MKQTKYTYRPSRGLCSSCVNTRGTWVNDMPAGCEDLPFKFMPLVSREYQAPKETGLMLVVCGCYQQYRRKT